MVSFGTSRFQWDFLGTKFLMPLALSPLLSLVIVYLFIWPVAWAVNRVTGKCAYVLEGTAIHPATMNAAVLESTGLRVTTGDAQSCGAETAAVALQGIPF